MGFIRTYVQESAISVPSAIASTAGLLYGTDSSGNLKLADQTAVGATHALGFAITSVTVAQAGAGRPVGLARIGIVDLLAAEIAGGAFTIGQEVFLDTAGKWSTTYPSTNGNTIQAVGIAIGATKVAAFVMPPIAKLQAAGNSTLAVVA